MRRLSVSSRKFWFFYLPKFGSCHSADLSLFGPGRWGCQGRAGFARRGEPLTTPPARPYPLYQAEWLALSPHLALPRFPTLASSTHGNDSYTLLLFSLLVEPTICSVSSR